MATHTGSEGTVKTGTPGSDSAIAEIRSFSVNETADVAEDTSMGDTYRTHKLTLKSFDGSADVFWDETDTSGQVALAVGTEATVTFYPEGSTTGDTYLSGTVIVTGKTINSSFDGLVEASITFQGTGALTTTIVA